MATKKTKVKKKKKKTKLPYKEIINTSKCGDLKYDYGYGIVKYEYDTVDTGAEYNSIVNGRITEIGQLQLYENISGKNTIDNINDYCLDRFIKKSFTKDVVLFIIEYGYYGGEAGYHITNSFGEELNNFIIKLNSNNKSNIDSELIEEILILEYGYILPELREKNWKFLNNIELDKINPAAGMRHVDKNIIDAYKKVVENSKYNLTCLCINYRLIDGYHRYAAANQLKHLTIDIITCM